MFIRRNMLNLRFIRKQTKILGIVLAFCLFPLIGCWVIVGNEAGAHGSLDSLSFTKKLTDVKPEVSTATNNELKSVIIKDPPILFYFDVGKLISNYFDTYDDPKISKLYREITRVFFNNNPKLNYGFISSSHLANAPVSGKTRLLIMADQRYISNEIAENLRKYVSKGGTILLVGSNGVFDVSFRRNAQSIRTLSPQISDRQLQVLYDWRLQDDIRVPFIVVSANGSRYIEVSSKGDPDENYRKLAAALPITLGLSKNDKLSPIYHPIPHEMRMPKGLNTLRGSRRIHLPGRPPSPSQEKNFIRDFDMNEDGFVSSEEFPGPVEVFNRLDINRDGVITKEEAEADGTVSFQTLTRARRDRISNYNDSPFGIAGYLKDFKLDIQKIGITSIRYGGILGVNWAIVEGRSIPEKRRFWGWAWNDELFKNTYENGLEMSVVLESNENPVQANRLDKYGAFVSSVAERYDGDSVNDAEGSPVVTYWEIDNEPDFIIPESDLIGIADKSRPWKGNMNTAHDYALTLKTAYKAIKSASPTAKVAIGSLALHIEYIEQVFVELEKLKDSKDDVFFDVFNFHFYGKDSEYGRNPLKVMMMGKQGGPSISEIKTLLDKYGYSDVELIITEAGTPSDTKQTETDQAISLVKRYVYPISEGVDRIYWLGIKYSEHLSELFANIALIDKNNHKKLSYYTYRKMVEILGDSDWDNVETIIDGTDNVYAYKFVKDNGSAYVVWWDYFDYADSSRTISLSELGISGNVTITEAVPNAELGTYLNEDDYPNFFATETKTVNKRNIQITLKKNPIYIEVK